MDGEALRFEDLKELCDEGAQESLTLEFKPCAELKVGSDFYKSGKRCTRTRDDVLDELTRDVTALLNAAGGRIIYGIREKSSRAEEIDTSNPFCRGSTEDNVHPEKIVDWLRAHVQPAPTVHPYRVFSDPEDTNSPWYLVIEVPQGEQAYMARDHKFYKRVGTTVQLMEQYEVVDVMNRVRGAALEIRMSLREKPRATLRVNWLRVMIDIAVTSTNFIASEHGALKLTVAFPVQFGRGPSAFPGVLGPRGVGLPIEGEEDVPFAEQWMLSWGAGAGTVIFPEHWHDFGGHPLVVEVLDPETIRDATYLVQTELFTLNSRRRKRLFAIRREDYDDDFALIGVDASNRDDVVGAFWRTYHAAQQRLRESRGDR